MTKTDGQTTAARGRPITYTITVANLGPDGIAGATVVDNVPAAITGASWTCAATAGSSCSAASGLGNINTTVNLLNGGVATFTLTGTINASTTLGSSLSNTATAGVGASGAIDPVAGNNSSTDTDTIRNPQANLSISKSNNVSNVLPGSTVVYQIRATNGGPNSTGATVTDNFPSALINVTWTCTASAGSSCSAASGSGNISSLVNLAVNGNALFTVTSTVSLTATVGYINVSTVAPAAGTTDPSMGNNVAFDADAITTRDAFLRLNSTNLGSNWSPGSGTQAIRVNNTQAFANSAGQAMWNASGSTFGAKQLAAFTFVQSGGSPAAPLNGSSLLLKASGGTASSPASFIRVRYTGTQVIVETTTNSGSTYTNRGSMAATFATNDRFSVIADVTGTVYVYRNNTLLGTVTGTTFTGTGRIGIQLPANARVDNFTGGTLP